MSPDQRLAELERQALASKDPTIAYAAFLESERQGLFNAKDFTEKEAFPAREDDDDWEIYTIENRELQVEFRGNYIEVCIDWWITSKNIEVMIELDLHYLKEEKRWASLKSRAIKIITWPHYKIYQAKKGERLEIVNEVTRLVNSEPKILEKHREVRFIASNLDLAALSNERNRLIWELNAVQKRLGETYLRKLIRAKEDP